MVKYLKMITMKLLKIYKKNIYYRCILMNTQTIILNRNNVVSNTNNTKYIYTFPQKVNIDTQEICLATLNMYYSWPNIQAVYNNHIFTYIWWDHLGQLNSVQNIIIPNGYYSISTLSSYIHSQMLLRGHYLVQNSNQEKVYFISMIENPTYYACQITFSSMFQKGSVDAGEYTNENPPSQVNGVWTGWDLPATKEYPKVQFLESSKMRNFLGFHVGTYPVNGTTISTTFDLLSQNAPNTYPVSSINIQSNFVKSEISIPNNILYSFSQGTASYGDLIDVHPQNLIWFRVPDGVYNQLEITFIDQDFNPMIILDSQINMMILLRDV
jgi:hypothetical protein